MPGQSGILCGAAETGKNRYRISDKGKEAGKYVPAVKMSGSRKAEENAIKTSEKQGRMKMGDL